MTLILVLSSIAISHALFWAIVLIGMNRKLSNRLLAALLILLSLRVGKSVIGMLSSKDIMYVSSSVGVFAMSAIGPVLFLFTKSLFDSNYRPGWKDWIQFLPTVVLLAFIPFPNWDYISRAYSVFTSLIAVYIILSLVFLWRSKENFVTDDMKWKWIHFIIAGIGILWVTFVCQLLFYQPLVYLSIVVTAAVVFYSLSWYAIPRSRLFIADPLKKVSDVNAHQELGARILHLLEKEQLYISTDLTVTTLAARLKSPPYMVSRAINQCFSKSFSELVVEYRIRKAEELLASDSQKSLTIEAIAFESGFNTLSAFYKAFKKMNGTTPSQYRENSLGK